VHDLPSKHLAEALSAWLSPPYLQCGANIEAHGPRFLSCAALYDPALTRLAKQVAKEAGIQLKQGTYVFTTGPSYEVCALMLSLSCTPMRASCHTQSVHRLVKQALLPHDHF
jgi:hypothetical protein